LLPAKVTPVCQLAIQDPPVGTSLNIAGWGYLGDEAVTRPWYLSVTKLHMFKPLMYYGEIRFWATYTSACLVSARHDSVISVVKVQGSKGKVDGWMDGWMDGRKEGRKEMDGWMDG
jgi:hypothetical protein